MKTLEITLEMGMESADAVRRDLVAVEKLYYDNGAADPAVSVVLRRLHALVEQELEFLEQEARAEVREARLAARPTIAEKWNDE